MSVLQFVFLKMISVFGKKLIRIVWFMAEGF